MCAHRYRYHRAHESSASCALIESPLTMKIDEIDAYVTVIRCQSLQQAALSLGLTQPAITRRLQNFEEALGVELLDRNTRPLKATATGRVVYEQCRVIQRELDVLREIVATDTPPVGTLRLGVAQTIADIALTDAMRGLKAAYPDLQARASTGWGSQLLQRVEQGELDAAAILLPNNKTFDETLSARSLGRIKLAVVALERHVEETRACTDGMPVDRVGVESGWLRLSRRPATHADGPRARVQAQSGNARHRIAAATRR